MKAAELEVMSVMGIKTLEINPNQRKDTKTNVKLKKSQIEAAINVANTTARQLTTGPKFRNQIVNKMAEFLKQRFLDLEEDPVPLADILKGMEEENIDESLKEWLQTDAEKVSTRLKLTPPPQSAFYYVPPLKCRDKESLLELLKHNDQNVLGGIYLSDIENSVPNSERILQALESQIVVISGPDKVQVIFYNQRIPEIEKKPYLKELKDAWNHLEDIDIETTMDKIKRANEMVTERWSPISATKDLLKKGKKKRDAGVLRDNKHVAHLLIDYPEDY